MKNADSLVAIAATAAGACSIAIGNGASSVAGGSIAIGCGSKTLSGGSANALAIMTNAQVTNSGNSIAIGVNSCASGWSELIAIGFGAVHAGNGYGGLAIGCGAVTGGDGVALGRGACVTGNWESGDVAISTASRGLGISAIAIGRSACVPATVTCGIAIGRSALATANGAVALGEAVTAATVNYTTTKNLQLTNYVALNYADDTAAAAGGVPLGGLYHNAGAARIRIA